MARTVALLSAAFVGGCAAADPQALVAAASAAVTEATGPQPYTHQYIEVAECNAEYSVAAKRLCEEFGVKEYCPEEEVKKINSKEEGAPTEVEAETEYAPPGKQQKAGWDHLKHGADWGCPAQDQSPVDIQRDVDLQGQSKFVMWFDFKAPVLEKSTSGLIVNDGHSLYFDAEHEKVGLGDVKLGHNVHTVRRYDFHSPSEHTIDGQRFPLELEILTVGPHGQKVMVSVLFRESKNSNSFLAGLRKQVKEMPKWTVKGGDASVAVKGEEEVVFDLENAVPLSEIHPGGDMTFYNYEGSMTFPPCEGGVDWWVTQEPLDATKEELEHISKAILGSVSMADGNYRLTQDLHNRPVMIGHTGLQHHTGGHRMPKKTQERLRGTSTNDMPWGTHWKN